MSGATTTSDSAGEQRCAGCGLALDSVREVRVQHADGTETLPVCDDCESDLNARVLEEVDDA